MLGNSINNKNTNIFCIKMALNDNYCNFAIRNRIATSRNGFKLLRM